MILDDILYKVFLDECGDDVAMQFLNTFNCSEEFDEQDDLALIKIYKVIKGINEKEIFAYNLANEISSYKEALNYYIDNQKF